MQPNPRVKMQKTENKLMIVTEEIKNYRIKLCSRMFSKCRVEFHSWKWMKYFDGRDTKL
jgi:hypothetical protein